MRNSSVLRINCLVFTHKLSCTPYILYSPIKKYSCSCLLTSVDNHKVSKNLTIRSRFATTFFTLGGSAPKPPPFAREAEVQTEFAPLPLGWVACRKSRSCSRNGFLTVSIILNPSLHITFNKIPTKTGNPFALRSTLTSFRLRSSEQTYCLRHNQPNSDTTLFTESVDKGVNKEKFGNKRSTKITRSLNLI